MNSTIKVELVHRRRFPARAAARAEIGARTQQRLLAGIEAQSSGRTTFVQACALPHAQPPQYDPAADCPAGAGFDQAVAAANAADQVVLALRESREMSGEAASRSEIDLPGKQQELIDRIKATGKPFVAVLFNGRPLTLERVAASSAAILEAWSSGRVSGCGRRSRRVRLPRWTCMSTS